MTTPTLTHVHHSHLDLHYGDTKLFRYIYQPDTEQRESPKPYFHPLKTLAGNTVTNHRPYDHVWHPGMTMTMAVLSGQNFWGGPSYVNQQGYVQLPNNGRQDHQRWESLRCDEEAISFEEDLNWITLNEEHWLTEKRSISVSEINPDAGYWVLDVGLDLKNMRSEALVFGSPTTEGRPLAGYGGLFWRGPRSFLNGQILAGDDLSGPEVMGQAAPWLAFTGWHDGVYQQSTLLFIDQPGNPRYPNKWFVRNDPFACASFAFSFDEELILETGDSLTFQYRIVIIDGPWSREQVEAYLVSS